MLRLFPDCSYNATGRLRDFNFTLGSPNKTPELGFLDVNLWNAPTCKVASQPLDHPTLQQSPRVSNQLFSPSL